MQNLEELYHLERLRKSAGWILDTCLWQFGLCVQNKAHSWNSTTNIEKRKYYQESKYLQYFSLSNMQTIASNLDASVEKKFGYRLVMEKEEMQKMCCSIPQGNLTVT